MSTCRTPGAVSATRARRPRAARHGAQKPEESWRSVARSPSGPAIPSASGDRDVGDIPPIVGTVVGGAQWAPPRSVAMHAYPICQETLVSGRPTRALAVAGALSLALAACTGSDDGEGEATPTVDPGPERGAVQQPAEGVSALPGADGALALEARRTFFAEAPVVVLAADADPASQPPAAR